MQKKRRKTIMDFPPIGFLLFEMMPISLLDRYSTRFVDVIVRCQHRCHYAAKNGGERHHHLFHIINNDYVYTIFLSQ